MTERINKENKKNKLKKFIGAVKEDVKTENSDYKYIVLKFLIIAISVIISLFWAPFSFIVLIEAIIFACFQLNGRALYYVLFIMPFMQIFRNKPTDTYFLTYLVGVIIFVLGLKLLLDVIRKKKKIEWLFSIVAIILLIYISIPRENAENFLRYWGSLVIGICVVIIAYYYRKDINFKELAFSFIIGFLFSCFLGVFRNISRLPTMVGDFYYYGERLTAAYINPNVLMGEGALCLAMIMILFLNKKIEIMFYPALVLVTSLILFTRSKVGLILILLLYICFVVILFCGKLTRKQVFKNIFIFLLMVATLGVYYKKPIQQIINRISDSVETTENNTKKENETGDSGNNSNSFRGEDYVISLGDKKLNLTELSTGRFDIWKTYLKASTKNINTFLWGYGVGAPFIGEWQGWIGWQPHNTFIQALYYVGAFGLFLILLLLLLSISKNKLKRFNISSILMLIALGLYLSDLEFFSFRLGIYMILLYASLGKDIEENENGSTKQQKEKQFIPKTIHYIWLGSNPLPKTIQKCIESWKTMCPDYEVKRWDESNLNIDCCKYCRQAYDAKKYAFASDVLRFYILYKEGGIYLDVDVELLKPLDELLYNHAFMGFEQKGALNPGLILGAEKNCKLIKDIYETYQNDDFIMKDGSCNLNTICIRTTDYLTKKGLRLNNEMQLIDDTVIYPTEFFCPLSPITDKKEITKKSFAIHLYYASWFNRKAKMKKEIKKILNFITNGYFGIALYNLKNRHKKEN